MSFAEKGVVPLNAALALIIGANIGTALNPLLEGARGGDAAGRRVVVGNLITRLAGAAVATPLLSLIGVHLVQIEPNFSRAVADFHTAFNLLIALAFLPLLQPLARLLERLVPIEIGPADPKRPLYLDDPALETPPIALGHASREALRMVDVLDSMIEGVAARRALGIATSLPRSPPGRLARRAEQRDQAILSRLDPETLTDDEHRRAEAVLAFSLNLEGAGDVVERNLASFVAKRLKRGSSRRRRTIRRSGRLSRLFAQTCAPPRRCSRPAIGAPRGSFRSRRPSSAAARAKRSRPISPGFASSARPRRPRLIFCAISSVLTTIWWPGRPIPSL